MGYVTIKNSKLEAEDYVLSKSEHMKSQYRKWIAYWRLNPQRFVREYLKIESLKPFQEYILYEMIHNKNFMYLASRAQGKTFLTALYAVTICILYPGTKVVIAAGKKGQGMKIVTEKLPELMAMSPILKYEFTNGSKFKTSMTTDDPNVEFLNGSWIKVVAATENARSGRANVLILDEFRMIDPTIYQNTLRRFLGSPRQPRYLSKKEYNTKELRSLEKNRQVLLSSAYFKHNWGYKMYRTYYKKMVEGSFYNVVAFPYQKSIEHGLLVEEDIKEEMGEDTFSPIVFSMEMECMFYGENENAFYQLKDLENNRQITKAIYPREFYEKYGNKNFKYRKKRNGEIRIISADIARVAGKQNDASAYSIMSLYKDGGRYKISVDYMETMVGGHGATQALRIRQLFDDFECDYIVIDIAGQTTVSDHLLRDIHDKERDVIYPAFKFMNKDEYNDESIMDAEERIYGMRANVDSNMVMARQLRDNMKQGKVKFLINSNDAIEYVTKAKNYAKLTIEEQASLQHPYIQIDNFVNEIIALELKFTDSGKEKLVEPRSARKDRYSSILYGHHFLKEKEKEFTNKKVSSNFSDYMFF